MFRTASLAATLFVAIALTFTPSDAAIHRVKADSTAAVRQARRAAGLDPSPPASLPAIVVPDTTKGIDR